MTTLRVVTGAPLPLIVVPIPGGKVGAVGGPAQDAERGELIAGIRGTNAGVFVVGLPLAFAAGAMALISWRRVLPMRDRDATRHWWAFVLVACALVVTGATVAACGSSGNAFDRAVLQPPHRPARGRRKVLRGHGPPDRVAGPPQETSSPAETEAQFSEEAGWFDLANRNAPTQIAEYAHYLSTVGFNLDTDFNTKKGRRCRGAVMRPDVCGW